MARNAQLSTLTVRTEADAPDAGRELLQSTRERMGMVPNMYGAMANYPATLGTYLHGYDAFRRTTTLTPVEQEVVMLAISVANECSYCVAAHSTVADLSRVPAEITEALRDGKPLEDARLQALRDFTSTLVTTRGRAAEEDLQAFLTAGYAEQQVLEVVLAIAVKTLSNYTNHLVGTEVDAAFAPRAWAPASS